MTFVVGLLTGVVDLCTSSSGAVRDSANFLLKVTVGIY